MLRLIKKSSRKIGLSPGVPVLVDQQPSFPVTIQHVVFDDSDFEHETFSPERVTPAVVPSKKNWYHVEGIHNIESLNRLAEAFSIHTLVVEDIVNTAHRPKIEYFEDYTFIVLRLVDFDTERRQVISEQVGIVYSDDWMLSFRERPGAEFQPLLDRMKSGRGRIRRMGHDYLAYAMADIIVDRYFLALEAIGKVIERFDEELEQAGNADQIGSIHRLERELQYFLKLVWPLRELVSRWLRDEDEAVSEESRPFLRDLADHAIHVVDTVETYRGLLIGMLDTSLNLVSFRTNEVMKVLTLIATIFIPLTFIAGIYGMNFSHMPELHYTWSYPILLGVMLIIAVLMVLYFRHRKWI
jgi:magnesium transporter